MHGPSSQHRFERDVVAAYRRGDRIARIKSTFHIGPERLYRILSAHRVPLRSDSLDEAAIVRAYVDGEVLSVIQRRFHVRRGTIHAVLARHGVPPRQPLRRMPQRAGYCARCGIALDAGEVDICGDCRRTLAAGVRHARGELTPAHLRDLGVLH